MRARQNLTITLSPTLSVQRYFSTSADAPASHSKNLHEKSRNKKDTPNKKQEKQ
jgi:hypothetical protein